MWIVIIVGHIGLYHLRAISGVGDRWGIGELQLLLLLLHLQEYLTPRLRRHHLIQWRMTHELNLDSLSCQRS